MNEYYVYEHRNLEDKVIYIGKGSGSRYKDGQNRNEDWHKATEHGVKWRILMGELTNAEALELEKFIIADIGIENLTNKPSRKHSIETKKKISLVNKGRKRSKETIEKIRKAAYEREARKRQTDTE